MSKVPTRLEISAGGVAYRKRGGRTEVVLISVGPDARWQLPKGLVNKKEPTEAAAIREVREEAGIETVLVGPIDKVEYWYYSSYSGTRERIHKFVYFYLLKYAGGDVSDHDDEVNEARWFEIGDAIEQLAFASEKTVTKKALELIKEPK
jgi:8-oxo-dGTP pyrophosphatase MutT (NUDIX family)